MPVYLLMQPWDDYYAPLAAYSTREAAERNCKLYGDGYVEEIAIDVELTPYRTYEVKYAGGLSNETRRYDYSTPGLKPPDNIWQTVRTGFRGSERSMTGRSHLGYDDARNELVAELQRRAAWDDGAVEILTEAGITVEQASR